MTPDAKALAERLAACPRWRYQFGCVVEVQVLGVPMHAVVVEAHLEGRSLLVCGTDGTCFVVPAADALPVLEGDEGAPTRGVLLAQVRKAWKCPTVYAAHDSHNGANTEGWSVWRNRSWAIWYDIGNGDAETEALVLALEAAP